MKYLLVKDKKIRKNIKKLELNRLFLKAIIFNLKLKESIREYAYLKLKTIPQITNKIRATNRCVFTNRRHAVFNRYKVSRLVFKDFVSCQRIAGIYRKSW